MKNQKGVTLVALVVTIIVLLILAGVSVAMLTGDNGILTQANSAKNKTNTSKNEELIRLTYNAAKLRFAAASKDDKGKTFVDLLRDEASSSKYDVNIDETYEGSGLYTFSFADSKIEYTLDFSSGNITQDDGSLKLTSLFKGIAYPGESSAKGTITQTTDGFIADIENCR